MRGASTSVDSCHRGVPWSTAVEELMVKTRLGKPASSEV